MEEFGQEFSQVVAILSDEYQVERGLYYLRHWGRVHAIGPAGGLAVNKSGDRFLCLEIHEPYGFVERNRLIINQAMNPGIVQALRFLSTLADLGELDVTWTGTDGTTYTSVETASSIKAKAASEVLRRLGVDKGEFAQFTQDNGANWPEDEEFNYFLSTLQQAGLDNDQVTRPFMDL